MKNARRWKVIEIRPMPKVNSKYTVHGSGKPGVTQNRQQQHAVHRSVATQNTLAANPPPAAQISTCSSRMTKSTEIHQNQQPQGTEIRVKPNQDAQNDLGGHETQSEIQKAGPNRQKQHAVHRQYTSSSLQQFSTIRDSVNHHCTTNRVLSYPLTSILNLISKTWANLCDTKFFSALYAATSSSRVLSYLHTSVLKVSSKTCANLCEAKFF